MGPQLRPRFLILLLTLNLKSTLASTEPKTEAEYDVPEKLERGVFSSSDSDANGHTFSYEFLSPQKILTGCSGTKFSNGDTKTAYYFVDATGTKKFIRPGGSAEVVFPSPSGLPGLTRKQNVFMYEMCYPTPCNVPSGAACGPAGSTIGPVGWSLPKFPWLPWTSKDKNNVYHFNINSNAAAEASLATHSASVSVGVSGAAEAHVDKGKPSNQDNGTGGWTSPGPSDSTPGGWTSPPPAGWTAPGSSGSSGSASAEANAAASVSGGEGQASADAQAGASANSGESGWGWSSTTQPTTTKPPGWGWSTTTKPTTKPPGWGWSSTTKPTTTKPPGWGWSSTTKPTTKPPGWGWSSSTPPSTTTPGWAWSSSTSSSTSSTPGWGWWNPSSSSTTPPPTTPNTTTGGWPSTTTTPPTNTTTGWGWVPPPPCNTTTTTTTTPPPDTTTTPKPPAECNCTATASAAASAVATATVTGGGGGSDCPGECNCCDKCPVSKFMEKLAVAGFGNNWNQGPPGPAMNKWSSGSWNTFSTPVKGQPDFPFFRSEDKTPKDENKRRTDAKYYAQLPGSIRGQAPVIYYASCDPDAYVQPAILNYCPGTGEAYIEREDFKRSIEPVPDYANDNGESV